MRYWGFGLHCMLLDGIEDFLRVLQDECWHGVDDVASTLGWTHSKTMRLAVEIAQFPFNLLQKAEKVLAFLR